MIPQKYGEQRSDNDDAMKTKVGKKIILWKYSVVILLYVRNLHQYTCFIISCNYPANAGLYQPVFSNCQQDKKPARALSFNGSKKYRLQAN